VISIEIIEWEHDQSFEASPVILIHGGAGYIPLDHFQAKFDGMKEAVRAGYKVLEETDNVLDAVEAAIHVMEDKAAFNAGRGSKLNIFGHVEMDASIMDGNNLAVGSVASVGNIRHPVTLARHVMENTSHVLVVSGGAERLAEKWGVEQVLEDWLVTEDNKLALDEWLKEHNISHLTPEQLWETDIITQSHGIGTVGAVAFKSGKIAAATSTGGITGKLPGRVGDSPIVGHGVFADNESVGVSCTGTGETFMRSGVARRIGWLVEQGIGAQEAAQGALEIMRGRVGGEGGVIAIDKYGQLGIEWNSEMMAWAYGREGELHYGIERGDDFVEDL